MVGQLQGRNHIEGPVAARKQSGGSQGGRHWAPFQLLPPGTPANQAPPSNSNSAEAPPQSTYEYPRLLATSRSKI